MSVIIQYPGGVVVFVSLVIKRFYTGIPPNVYHPGVVLGGGVVFVREVLMSCKLRQHTTYGGVDFRLTSGSAFSKDAGPPNKAHLYPYPVDNNLSLYRRVEAMTMDLSVFRSVVPAGFFPHLSPGYCKHIVFGVGAGSLSFIARLSSPGLGVLCIRLVPCSGYRSSPVSGMTPRAPLTAPVFTAPQSLNPQNGSMESPRRSTFGIGITLPEEK